MGYPFDASTNQKGIKVPLGFSSSQLQTSTFLGHTDAVPEPVEGKTARLACPRRAKRRACRSTDIVPFDKRPRDPA